MTRTQSIRTSQTSPAVEELAASVDGIIAVAFEAVGSVSDDSICSVVKESSEDEVISDDDVHSTFLLAVGETNK